MNGDAAIFVHSSLDDYGLTPNEFRVLARVARRGGRHGECYEGIPEMAASLQIAERSVRRALELLVMCQILNKTKREGRPSIYKIRPLAQWKKQMDLQAIRTELHGGIQPVQNGPTPARRDRGKRRTPAETRLKTAAGSGANNGTHSTALAVREACTALALKRVG